MSRIVNPLLLVGLALMNVAVFAVSANATTSKVVRVNPFAQPLVIAPAVSLARSKPAMATGSTQAPVQLRGVLQAGQNSFANVDGKIVGLGEVVDGMRLQSVSETAAVFLRDGKRLVLKVSSAPAFAPRSAESIERDVDNRKSGNKDTEKDKTSVSGG